jgi:hypothetical protein
MNQEHWMMNYEEDFWIKYSFDNDRWNLIEYLFSNYELHKNIEMLKEPKITKNKIIHS